MVLGGALGGLFADLLLGLPGSYIFFRFVGLFACGFTAMQLWRMAAGTSRRKYRLLFLLVGFSGLSMEALCRAGGPDALRLYPFAHLFAVLALHHAAMLWLIGLPMQGFWARHIIRRQSHWHARMPMDESVSLHPVSQFLLMFSGPGAGIGAWIIGRGHLENGLFHAPALGAGGSTGVQVMVWLGIILFIAGAAWPMRRRVQDDSLPGLGWFDLIK